MRRAAMRRAMMATMVWMSLGSSSAWAQVPPPAPEAEAEEDSPVSIGEGRLQLSGLFQVWLFNQFGEDTQGGESNLTSNFRIRRTELKLEGALLKDLVEMGVMVDPAKLVLGTSALGDSREVETLEDRDGDGVLDSARVPLYRANDSILQDLYVAFLPREHLRLKVGQFKRPLGYEGPRAASLIVFDERSQLSVRLSGDNRDIGLLATITLDAAKLKIDIGIFNGTPIGASAPGAAAPLSGINEADENAWKDVVLSVGAQPVDGLELGVSGLAGKEGRVNVPGPNLEPATDLRYGAWIRFARGRIDLRTEALFQSFDAYGVPYVPAGGVYVLGEYRVVDPLGLGLRYDYYDSNSETEGDRSVNHNVTLGANWYIHSNNAKLQLAYTFSYEGDLSEIDTEEESGQQADDTVVLVAQAAF